MEKIPFLVQNSGEVETDQKGLFSAAVTHAEVPIAALRHNWSQVSQAVLETLSDVRQIGQFRLKEVTLQLEVSANGSITLIGAANIGGKGAVTLKFAD
ncbi:hypothetical protein ACFL5Z_03835 [Planctomycetota bacterium]